MTRINLFPWREESDEIKRKQFLVIIAAVMGMTILTMFFVNWQLNRSIVNQKDINTYLNQELVQINKELRDIDTLKSQKDALISRLSVIEEVEGDRYHTINLLNEIVALINPLIVLEEVVRENNLVTINGYAESNTEVAKFLRALEISEYFSKAQLNQIKVKPIYKNRRKMASKHFFELQFEQNYIKNKSVDTNDA